MDDFLPPGVAKVQIVALGRLRTLLPSQLGVVWSLLLQADSGGPSPISDKAFTAHNLRGPSPSVMFL
jgi:hypothetical protein